MRIWQSIRQHSKESMQRWPGALPPIAMREGREKQQSLINFVACLQQKIQHLIG